MKLEEVDVEVVQFLFLVDLAWCPSLIFGLCVSDLMSHPTFPCWGPLASATGSVVHTSCGLDIAVPTALDPAPPIGGARVFGYGGAQQGKTGGGIEAAHKATCSQAKDAQPAWHGAESARGVWGKR